MKKSSKTLIIDTATDYLYLAYLEDGVVKDDVHRLGRNDHSVNVMPELKAMLDRRHLTLPDLDNVVVGIGPGSYTGVRIGVSIAKMIGYMNEVDLYTVSTLALMATASNQEYIVPFIDARRGNAYMALYRQTDEGLFVIKDDRIAPIEDFLDRLTFTYDKIITQKPKPGKLFVSQGLLEKVGDIHGLAPNYLQITEAERNLRKRRGT